MDKARKIHITITIGISLIIVLLSVLFFQTSWLRLFETFRDFGVSVKYYFCKLFEVKTSVLPTVTDYSSVFSWNVFLPDSSEKTNGYVKEFFALFFNADNFKAWLNGVTDGLYVFLKILVLSLPCIVLIVILSQKIRQKRNNDYNEDTKPLKAYKAVENKVFVPVVRFVKAYIAFLKENIKVVYAWLILLAVTLNFASVFVAFFAYYFYFAVSFDVANLWVQFGKLIVDLQVVVKTIPLIGWLVIAYILFNRWRKNHAMRRLRHYEARNCGFINELPIVSMTCGSMGKKKTTLITDMALSQEVMFRQKALEILQKADMKFPYFPWICFEKELQKCMEYKTVYNLATVKAWIEKKRKRFEKHGNTDLQLYGYDISRYALTYKDGLKSYDIFDVLSTYAQAYFIYVIESSLIVSNYSMRTDNSLLDEGNFPLWALDFFSENERKSRFSHILDFDVLRLGKKVLENNPKAGSFEFGVVAITEIGKERGNVLDHKEIKKNTDETNQKNDLFNSWLKMCRHSATVDNFPFIKVFTDEQRPESWGSDARDLCDIIHIVSSGEQRLALPFYTIEEMLAEWAFGRFMSLYTDFRYRRGDNTLLVYVLKSITARLWKRNVKIYNKYGYAVAKIEKERGTMDAKAENKRYFLMNYKIYRNRFSTDCFSDYFNDLAKETKVGLNDYLEYATEKASVDELKKQNSYFINSLYGK